MFDIEEFEKELFELVNKQVNNAYTCLRSQGEAALLAKYVPLQLQIISIIHGIIEEIVGEYSNVLVSMVHEKAQKKKIRLFDMRKSYNIEDIDT